MNREELAAALDARYVGANPQTIAKAAEKYLAQLPNERGGYSAEIIEVVRDVLWSYAIPAKDWTITAILDALNGEDL